MGEKEWGKIRLNDVRGVIVEALKVCSGDARVGAETGFRTGNNAVAVLLAANVEFFSREEVEMVAVIIDGNKFCGARCGVLDIVLENGVLGHSK